MLFRGSPEMLCKEKILKTMTKKVMMTTKITKTRRMMRRMKMMKTRRYTTENCVKFFIRTYGLDLGLASLHTNGCGFRLGLIFFVDFSCVPTY